MPRQNNSSQPTAIYNRFVGRNIDFEELVYQAKKLVMTTALAVEWNVLANRLSQIAEAQPKTRDYTLNALRDAFLYNALAQTLLLLTSPIDEGVPDIYQGNEIWCFSLVDPDNRRPVDFEIGWQLLSTIDNALVDDRLSLLNAEDGRIKLFLTSQTLRLRSRYAALFESGEYLRLSINGPRSDNLVAFARRDPEQFVVILASRFMKHLSDEDDIWAETRLELPADVPLHYSNILTTGKLSAKAIHGHLELDIEDMLGAFPVSLLVGG